MRTVYFVLVLLLVNSGHTHDSETALCDHRSVVLATLRAHNQERLEPALQVVLRDREELVLIQESLGLDNPSAATRPELSDTLQQAKRKEIGSQRLFSIEARRTRDLRFIAAAIPFVDKLHAAKFGRNAAQTDAERRIDDILFSINRQILDPEKDLIEHEPTGKCSIANTLKDAAHQHYVLVQQNETYRTASRQYSQFISQYGSGKDIDRIPPDERDTYLSAQATTEQMFADILYASSLYRLGELDDYSRNLAKTLRADPQLADEDTRLASGSTRSDVEQTSELGVITKGYERMDQLFPEETL